MTRVTKTQFNLMNKNNIGGDLWNITKLSVLSFQKHQNAKSIEFNIGSGLAVNVLFTLANGETIQETIYDK